MKIRFSELFASFQGEADFTGMPSIWLRFFGCNLECNGFGQDNPCDPTTYDLPYQSIDLSGIQLMEHLPVLTKGCDSGYSWSNRFKHLAYDSTEKDLAEQILRLAREKFGVINWMHPVVRTNPQLCFTGGEPMMQQKAMAAICSELYKQTSGEKIPQITIETNGTKPLNREYMDSVREVCNHIHFAISPKLFATSGEKNAVNAKIISDYCGYGDTAAIKFVVNGSEESWKELESYEYFLKDLPASLWIMPVGASKEDQSKPSVAEIANEAMLRGYRVAARVHAYVYSNQMGT